VTWPRPLVVVAAVGAGCRVVLESVLDDEVELVDVDDVVEPAVVPVAAVDADWLPGCEIAATVPKTATAAALASAVPTVSVRTLSTARSRAFGLRRCGAFMTRVCRRPPFDLVTSWHLAQDRPSARARGEAVDERRPEGRAPLFGTAHREEADAPGIRLFFGCRVDPARSNLASR